MRHFIIHPVPKTMLMRSSNPTRLHVSCTDAWKYNILQSENTSTLVSCTYDHTMCVVSQAPAGLVSRSQTLQGGEFAWRHKMNCIPSKLTATAGTGTWRWSVPSVTVITIPDNDPSRGSEPSTTVQSPSHNQSSRALAILLARRLSSLDWTTGMD